MAKLINLYISTIDKIINQLMCHNNRMKINHVDKAAQTKGKKMLLDLTRQFEQLSFAVNTSKDEKQFERGRVAQIMIDHDAIKKILDGVKNGD